MNSTPISRNGVFTAHPETAHGCMLITGQGRYPSDLPASTAERLLFSALNHHLDALWVTPGCIVSHLASQEATSHGLRTETDTVGVRSHVCPEGMTCLHLWLKDKAAPRADRRTIRVFFPEWDARWGLQEVHDPYVLLNTIDVLEQHLGIALDWSPGSSGIALLKKLNSNPVRAQWLRPVDFTGTPWDPSEEEQADGVTIPVSSPWAHKHWPMMDGLDSSSPLFFHVYDKSYAHGGACAHVNVGAGDPVHYQGDAIAYDGRFPGVWRIPGGKWVYTPEVDHMITGGYLAASQLSEAWIWPEYHQTMRSFAETFWHLEEQVSGHPLARMVGKKMRTQGQGWLAMDTREWRPDGAGRPPVTALQWFFRPDIWYTIVSALRVTMSRAITRLQLQGYDACWRNADELGFFSNDANPRTAVPLITRDTGMGSFRHRYTLRADDEVFYAFSDAHDFTETRALLLAHWREQQRLTQGETALVPAASAREAI